MHRIMNRHRNDYSSIKRPIDAIDGGDEAGGPRVATGGKRGSPRGYWKTTDNC